jgi:hypothetical protein
MGLKDNLRIKAAKQPEILVEKITKKILFSFIIILTP